MLGHSWLDCSIQPYCRYFIWYQVSLFCCEKFCKTVEKTSNNIISKNCIVWLSLFYFDGKTLEDIYVSTYEILAWWQNKLTSEMMKRQQMCKTIIVLKTLRKNGQKKKTKKCETKCVNVIYFALTISRLQWVSSFHCHGYSLRTEFILFVLQNPKKWSRYLFSFLLH